MTAASSNDERTADPPRIEPAEAERLCLDGIDLVDLYSNGEPDVSGYADNPVEAVVLYAQLLEATILTLYSAAHSPTDVPAIRAAAKDSARAWRRRATS